MDGWMVTPMFNFFNHSPHNSQAHLRLSIFSYDLSKNFINIYTYTFIYIYEQ